MEQQKRGFSYQWQVLIWLSMAIFIHQSGRAILGVTVPQVKADLGLSDSQIGFASTCLYWILACMIPISGFLGDRVSRKWIITWTLIIGSAATGLAGVAVGLWTLILFYSVTSGSCEALYSPPAFSLLAAYHKRTRSLAMAVHQCGLYLGILSSGFVAGKIADIWGWRPTFWIYGSAGVVLGLFFIRVLRDAPSDSHVEAVRVRESLIASVKVLVQIKSALLATGGFMALVFVNNAFQLWAPSFVQQKFNVTMAQAGGGVMFYHNLAAMTSAVIVGYLTDRAVKRDPKFRLKMQACGLLLGAPIVLLISCVDTLPHMWWMVALYGIFRGFFDCNTFASLYDVVPAKYHATASGLMMMAAFIVGSFSPWMLGRLSDAYGCAAGMKIGFVVLAAVFILGACCMIASHLLTFEKDRVVEEG